MLQSVLSADKQEDPLPPARKLLKDRSTATLIDGLVVGTISAILCLIVYKAFPANVHLSSWNLLLLTVGAFCVGFLDVLISFAPVFGTFFLVSVFLLALPNFFDVTSPKQLLAICLWFGSLYLTNWLYHAYFESKKGATIGMRRMNLRIAGSAGQRISFWRATFRHALKPITVFVSVIPILYVIFGNRMQAIHDRIARVYILPAALQASPSSLVERIGTEMNVPPDVEFAPLWRRVGSAVLDAVLYYSLAYSLFATLVKFDYENVVRACLDKSFMFSIAASLVAFAYLLSAFFVTALFASIEASRLQATLGKMVFGLKVINPDGGRIDFLGAMQKQIVQSLVYISLLPIVFVPIFSFACYSRTSYGPRLVMLIFPIFYLAYGFLLCATLFKGRQTVVDKISKRYVILDRKRSAVIE